MTKSHRRDEVGVSFSFFFISFFLFRVANRRRQATHSGRRVGGSIIVIAPAILDAQNKKKEENPRSIAHRRSAVRPTQRTAVEFGGNWKLFFPFGSPNEWKTSVELFTNANWTIHIEFMETDVVVSFRRSQFSSSPRKCGDIFIETWIFTIEQDISLASLLCSEWVGRNWTDTDVELHFLRGLLAIFFWLAFSTEKKEEWRCVFLRFVRITRERERERERIREKGGQKKRKMMKRSLTFLESASCAVSEHLRRNAVPVEQDLVGGGAHSSTTAMRNSCPAFCRRATRSYATGSNRCHPFFSSSSISILDDSGECGHVSSCWIMRIRRKTIAFDRRLATRFFFVDIRYIIA